MIDYSHPVATALVPSTLSWKDESDLETLISGINGALEQAANYTWDDPITGQHLAAGLLTRFTETAGLLEACGWSAECIKHNLGPSREVFATSSFMQRCQEWPRGHAGARHDSVSERATRTSPHCGGSRTKPSRSYATAEPVRGPNSSGEPRQRTNSFWAFPNSARAAAVSTARWFSRSNEGG